LTVRNCLVGATYTTTGRRTVVDELALRQPMPGYIRLLKESVLQIWKARKAPVRDELANAERAAN
jgi:hypothetical protein